VGLAYQIRKGSGPLDFNGGTALASSPNPIITENTDLVRFRARPGIRDAVGLQGLSTRVVDTGNIIAEDVQSVNGELLWYWGPLWVQSETCLAHVDNAVFPASNQGTRRGDLNYWGSYVQVGYFLTGDNRGYDKRMGKYDRVRPLENFFLVRDENGHVQYGLGAWEIIYRYGYVNLNDDFVRGGTYGEHTIGLNWYWNPNIKLQLNYINGQRNVPPGAASGNVQGLGLRAALEF
jgi:phosphate-selective porin OprO/OprP